MEATHPVEKPLSERIKATRKALGLSRVKAAKKWSISAATIRAWEEEKRNPSGLYLAQDYLDTSPVGTELAVKRSVRLNPQDGTIMTNEEYVKS